MLMHLRACFLLRLSEFMLLYDDHLPTSISPVGFLLDNLLPTACIAWHLQQMIVGVVLLIDSLKAVHHEGFLGSTVIFIE